MTRCINQVDLMAFPVKCDSSSPDSDSTLPLLFHVVHYGVAIVDLTRVLNCSSIEKHALSACGLASINVSNNTDISNFCQVYLKYDRE